jgi:hypothetical protein
MEIEEASSDERPVPSSNEWRIHHNAVRAVRGQSAEDCPPLSPDRTGGHEQGGLAIAVARRLFLEHQVLFAKHKASGGQAARWYLVTLVVLGVVTVGLAAALAPELV